MSERFHHPSPPRHPVASPELNGRVAQEIRNERERALQRIFGPTIKSFEFADDMRATDIFSGLLNHVFDSGTNRNVECDIQIGSELVHISEPAVPIHSRSSLITHSMEQIQKGKSLAFGMIDLQNFRSADFDLGKTDKGIHSADIIINKSARVIRAALKDVWKELGYIYKDTSYELARYGGDEFVIALFGDKAIASKEEIMKKVQEKLENETGYYQQNGEIKKMPIQLKKVDRAGNSVEWLSPPKEGPEREIYLDFFQRGTLFSENEFKRILTKYSPQGKLDMDLYRKDYPPHASSVPYPDEVGDDLDKKIAYITKNHPELIIPFEIAAFYDIEKPIKTSADASRQEHLLSIVENSIFDRLLGDMIYSKGHFGEHLRRGEVGEIYILDFKFLKEINTGMTYADADMEIKRLWESIKSTLSEEDRKKVVVSRFAGAFYIGLRKGEHLSGNKKLHDIEDLTLFNGHGEGINPTVPIGYARQRIHPHEYREFYKVINRTESDSDTYFYTRLIKDIIDESLKDPSFLEKMVSADIGSMGSGEEYERLSKADLYALLLKGKRKEARIKKVKKNIHEGATAAAFSFVEEKHTQIEINEYIKKVRDIRDILMADLEQNLHKS